MDIMDNPDESFDVIYCSHVLEHVPDDRKAMREFPRVLKRGGWAILLVPINAGKTYQTRARNQVDVRQPPRPAASAVTANQNTRSFSIRSRYWPYPFFSIG